jgi:isopenicillin N synthase-like dioxygenase
VVSPSEATDRLSVAFFLGARLDAQVKVLPLPERLRTLVRGLSADPLNPLFQHVGRNYLKGRLRSHVDVARRHYPELDVDAAGNY